MDVLIVSGERSGDLLAGELIGELQSLFSYGLDISAIGSPHTRAQGVRYLVDHTHFAMIGMDASSSMQWLRILDQLSPIVARDPPKIFVGVMHSIFNLLLVERLPSNTLKVLIEPPETWGWDVQRWFKWLTAAPALALRLCPMFLRTTIISKSSWLRKAYWFSKASFVFARRGELCLKYFDCLVCCTRMTQDTYEQLRRRKGGLGGWIVYVGQPALDIKVREGAESHIRGTMNVPQDAHILGIFPGSRKAIIRLLLPEMLKAANELLSERRDVVSVVHVADGRFAETIIQIMREHSSDWMQCGRMLHTGQPDQDLLASCSHAILSSGTVTLRAACLGIPATVAYTLLGYNKRWFRWLAGRIVVRKKVPRHLRTARSLAHGEEPSGHDLVPFALPNDILRFDSSWLSDELPYTECVLDHFRSDEIAQDVRSKLPVGPYGGVLPKLPDGMVKHIRLGARRGGNRPPMQLAARIIRDMLGQ